MKFYFYLNIVICILCAIASIVSKLQHEEVQTLLWIIIGVQFLQISEKYQTKNNKLF